MPFSILSPVIVGGLGTLIGNFFVNRQKQIAAEREFRAAELKRANALFDEISVGMGALAESSRNAMWALVLRPDREKQWRAEDIATWKAYNKELVAWNNSRARNLALTRKYFGDNAAEELESIQVDLEKLERMVAATYFDRGDRQDENRKKSRHYLGSIEDAQKKYLPICDTLLGHPGRIGELTEQMIEKIQKSEVGALATSNI